jgi:predicted RecA/RadA family phage recombinase
MENFVHPGEVITAIAPAGGVTSGDGVLIGAMFGVAGYTATAGAEVELRVEGVFTFAKTAGDNITAGARVFWDDTTKEITTTAAGNLRVGWATQTKAPATTTINVRLVPTTVALG